MGGGTFADLGCAPGLLLRHFLDDDSRFHTELQEASRAVARELQEDRTVRIGGPAGTAALGPRAWTQLAEADEEEWGCLLIELIQSRVDRVGFEDWHVANPLSFEGKNGQELVAALLVPETDLIYVNPEFLLLSEDLEALQIGRASCRERV